MLSNASGSYPSTLQGTITFNAGGSGNFKVGETVTSSGFSAKVVKWTSATKKLVVKKIVGNPAGAGTVTGGTSSAAWVVATVTTAAVGGVDVNKGGWNLRETKHGITRSKVVGSRTMVEVMLSQKGMATKRTDFATPPTFTLTGGAWSAGTLYDVSVGDYVTFSIVSSEAVKIMGTVTYPFTITGIGAKTGTFASSSADGLTHTFRYQVQAADIGGTGFSIAATNMVKGTGAQIDDINGQSLYPTSVVAVGGTLAAKTGCTIQA